ncbi:MAG: hypothetical protein IJ493_07090 [Clostridia bacterium]|nr:hypothetical protein [Clostridia bacterium]
MNKRIPSIALLTSLLLTTLASCGGSDTPGGDTTVSDTTTSAPETTSQFVTDELPDDLNLGGEQVNILIGDYNSAYFGDMYAEEANGSRLNDAIFNTIRSVEERLNADLVYTSESYTYSGLPAFQGKVQATIMAGDDSIDLLFDATNYTTQMMEGDYFANLADTKYIDIDKPWYNQSIRANIANDYVHFLSGQFAIGNIKNAFGIYFNADLYEALGKTEDLYTLVDEGKWTVNKLQELVKDSYADLNGDTSPDTSDRYGITFGDGNKYLGFITSLDVSIFQKTKDGYEFTYDSERALDAVSWLCSFINENENVMFASAGANGNANVDDQISSGGGNYVSKAFMEGRAVFTCSLIADAATIIPEITFDYGLLPYPKWDEEQEEYQSMLQRSCYTLIPVSANVDNASAVLEALSSESYRSLIPEYVEITLKTRYALDDNMSRMFDLIVNNIVYDPGEIYNIYLDAPSGEFRNLVMQNNSSWASHMASLKTNLITKMAEIVEKGK